MSAGVAKVETNGLFNSVSQQAAAQRPLDRSDTAMQPNENPSSFAFSSVAAIDPVTGVMDGRATRSAVSRMLLAPTPATLAIFEIDYFRSIQMQHGDRASEEVLWAVGKFLTTMKQQGIEIGCLGGERFCVLFSGVADRDVYEWCSEVLSTLAGLAASKSRNGLALSASIGIAPIAISVDESLKQGHIALIMARANGGKRIAASQFEQRPYFKSNRI